jgi:hypothetical protein
LEHPGFGRGWIRIGADNERDTASACLLVVGRVERVKLAGRGRQSYAKEGPTKYDGEAREVGLGGHTAIAPGSLVSSPAEFETTRTRPGKVAFKSDQAFYPVSLIPQRSVDEYNVL